MRLMRIVFGTSCLLLLVALVTPANAVPKGKNGESCNVSSETGVKHTIKGKDYKCDKCVYSKCIQQGDQLRCGNETHWSNCEEVASRPGAGTKGNVGGAIKDGVLEPTKPTTMNPKLPKADVPAVKSAP